VSPTLTASPAARAPAAPLRGLDVRTVSIRDLPSASSLLGAGLGEGFIDPLSLVTYADELGCTDRFALIASDTDTGRDLGVILADAPANVADMRALLPDRRAADRILNLLPGARPGRLGLIRSVAVTPGARRAGIGSRLVLEAVAGLRAAGAHEALSLGWSRAGQVPIRSPLQVAGLRAVGVLPHLWLEDSLVRGYDCEQCPNGQCRCEGVVFANPSLARAAA
jgi:GNAT superfamily N-acetyltransferase